jgi:triosephosphate isomerase
MRKPLIAGNWKMNLTVSDTKRFMSQLTGAIKSAVKDLEKIEVTVATPYLSLQSANQSNEGIIKVVAQNCSQHESGAYTGEISIPMLKDIGVNGAIVGHSERRQYFAETDKSVAEKTLQLIEAGLQSITCVGESLEQREAGQVEQVIGAQVTAVLNALPSYSEKLVIAYEPVWAIGTGKTASKEQAQEVHAFIRKLVRDKWGDSAADSVRILYGGSVKPANAKELLSQTDIDGALVGGASLKAEDFAAIAAATV